MTQFLPKVYLTHIGPPRESSVPMVAQSLYILYRIILYYRLFYIRRSMPLIEVLYCIVLKYTAEIVYVIIEAIDQLTVFYIHTLYVVQWVHNRWTFHENDIIFAQKCTLFSYIRLRIFSSYVCAIALPYKILPLIEALCLHMLCASHIWQQVAHVHDGRSCQGGLCLYTHSVAECWLCVATNNVCSFVGAPPVCVSIDCMCVCVVLNTWASYSSLTDASVQTYSIHTHVVLMD